jgi:hypothetical protein
MNKRIGLVLISFFTVTLTGCVSVNRIGDFTIVSSKNIDLSHGANFKRGTTRVTGQDMVSTAGFVPITPNMKTAIDRAIESTPGAIALLDGVISQKTTAWKVGYVVEGTPLIDPSLLANTMPTTTEQSTQKSK